MNGTLRHALDSTTARGWRVASPWRHRSLWQKPGAWLIHPEHSGVTINHAENARQLAAMGCRWTSLHFHDGHYSGFVLPGMDGGTPWVAKHYRDAGLKVVGWGGLGTEPEAEAESIVRFLARHNLDGFIADAEFTYKSDTGGDPGRSVRFVESFRRWRLELGYRRIPVALSTFGAASPPWSLADTFDYRPWQRRGWWLMPQAYPNVDARAYDPRWCVEHAVRAGWRRDRIALTIGIYGEGLPKDAPHIARWPASRYEPLLRGLDVPVNVFTSEALTPDDRAVLQRMLA